MRVEKGPMMHRAGSGLGRGTGCDASERPEWD